jgi:hypothetical protein
VTQSSRPKNFTQATLEANSVNKSACKQDAMLLSASEGIGLKPAKHNKNSLTFIAISASFSVTIHDTIPSNIIIGSDFLGMLSWQQKWIFSNAPSK